MSTWHRDRIGVGLFTIILQLGSMRAAEPVIPLWPEGVPGLRADAAAEKRNKISNF